MFGFEISTLSLLRMESLLALEHYVIEGLGRKCEDMYLIASFESISRSAIVL